MYPKIYNIEEFGLFLKNNKAVLTYFSTTECNICKVLKPKIENLIKAKFPKIKFLYIEINKSPEIAGQNRIFSVPTIVVFFEGKEYLRKSRSFSLTVLENEIQRTYEILLIKKI